MAKVHKKLLQRSRKLLRIKRSIEMLDSLALIADSLLTEYQDALTNCLDRQSIDTSAVWQLFHAVQHAQNARKIYSRYRATLKAEGGVI